MLYSDKNLRHYLKKATTPPQESIEFIYGLGHQHSYSSLVNYIASNFNDVKGLYCRKMQVADWLYALRWVVIREELYEEYLLPHFHKRIFNDTFNNYPHYKPYNEDNFNRALELLEHLENYEDIQTVGDGTYEKFTIPEISEETSFSLYGDQLRQTNEADFSSYSVNEQQFILSIYQSYLKTREELETGEEGFFVEEILDETAIYNVAIDEVEKKYETIDNATMVLSIWKHFKSLKKSANITVSEEDIKQYIDQEMQINVNMILTSYYLQYIILSIPPLSTEDQNTFGVLKFSGDQADIMQRLLCAVTSKNWDKLKQKSNSYYKTINNMFKIDTKDKYEIDGLIDQLSKVKDLLIQGGFEDAIKLINSDIEKIQALRG
ncbi:hypothetical protein [Paludibacter jiangxiensis]|uniref:Uncharacterized protein n=1 Tax=Paludibacter jiangxiensis TaxID=681398 RepID=A0A171A8W1_9BACT|nr:hypothetical protein [Paludibacter jiangxiensis]GAT63402.1 hypothetical protein PJIAN_3731 [Paludibacter jiangxiensis]